MKTQPHDDDLAPLLRQAELPTPSRNPNFRAEVWARIESRRREPATLTAWLQRHARTFASAAVLCVAAASLGGAWAADRQADRQRESLVQRYLASIDAHQQLEGDQR